MSFRKTLPKFYKLSFLGDLDGIYNHHTSAYTDNPWIYIEHTDSLT